MVTSSKMRAVFIHCTVWVIFILYEITVAIVMGSKAPLTEFAAFYLLDIGLFYFNSDIVFGFSQSFKKVMLILMPLIILELAAYTVLSMLIGELIYTSQTSRGIHTIDSDDLIRATWRGIYITGLSTGYWFFKRTVVVTKQANQFKILQLEAEKGKMETEKNLVIAQNSYLQSQINPHFLFNSLNYIYNSVQETAPQASTGIMLLSDIMQYALHRVAEDGKVLLTEEIAHIERYIKMNQLRFSNNLFVALHIHLSDDCRSCRIPPLLMLTFIENVFKHGNLTHQDKPARININCEQGILLLSTLNTKRKSLLRSRQHIGIDNARTRLNLYYKPENFDLAISDLTTQFSVTLRIKL